MIKYLRVGERNGTLDGVVKALDLVSRGLRIDSAITQCNFLFVFWYIFQLEKKNIIFYQLVFSSVDQSMDINSIV